MCRVAVRDVLADLDLVASRSELWKLVGRALIANV